MTNQPIPDFYEPRLPAVPPGIPPRIDPGSIPWRNGLLVRAPNWLGDTVMCLPGVYRMRRFLPKGCGLFVACPTALAPIWEAAPWVDVVAPFPERRILGDALGMVRRLGAGVGVVLPNSLGSALDMWRTRTPVRVGRRGNLRSVLLTHRLPAWRRSACRGFHQVCHSLEMASVFGAVTAEEGVSRLLAADGAGVAERLGIGPGGSWLAIAPGAAYGPAKQWPPEFFRVVAGRWSAGGGRVVAVGAPGEREICDRAIAGVAGAINLAGRTGLSEVIAVLSAVDAVVANDSGAMHLAAALGRGGVAVFGSTDPAATGPVGGRWIVLRQPMSCSPCFQRTCLRPESDYRCLRAITPELVWAALERVREGNRGAGR